MDPTNGKPLTTDQRGALRGSVGINAGTTVDIGAFEASSSYLVTSTADSTVLAGTLRSGVQWAGGSTNDNPENISHPAPNTVVFDTAGTFLVPQTITLWSTLTLPGSPRASWASRSWGRAAGSSPSRATARSRSSRSAAATATLQGLTITGGSAATGGGIGNAGNLTLKNIILMGNSATEGGGVYTGGAGSSLTIDGGTIEDNTALERRRRL